MFDERDTVEFLMARNIVTQNHSYGSTAAEEGRRLRYWFSTTTGGTRAASTIRTTRPGVT